MSSVCLSLVATLRCAGLDPSQNIAILVPPFIEAIFATTLIYTQYGLGRNHLLLVGESWLYLVLAVVDFASKANNGIALNLTAFATADRFIGATSGFPILLYTLFLLLLAKRNLLPALPPRYHWITQALLMCFIPLIFGLTEVGSLLGIGYAKVPLVAPLAPGQINPFAGSLTAPLPSFEITVRFFSGASKTAWTFLNSTALAFLFKYQLITFLLAATRLLRHYLGKRSKGMVSTEPSLGGLGWVAGGIKLGAIETLLGFIPNGFETSLSRRLLRMFGRSLIVYGVAKGLGSDNRTALFRVSSIDSIEGLPPRRVPVNVRDRIGRPVTGTFSKLSPTSRNFPYGTKPGEPFAGYGYGSDEKYPLPPPLRVQNATTPSTAQTSWHDPRYRPERVTVMYDGKFAPVLDIRFSELKFGDPSALMKKLEEAKYRPSPLARPQTDKPALADIPIRNINTYASNMAITPSKSSPMPFSNYATMPPRPMENPFADSTDALTLPRTDSEDSDPFNRSGNISKAYEAAAAAATRPKLNIDTGYPLQRSRTLPDEEMSVPHTSQGPPDALSPPRSTSIRSPAKRKPAPILSPSANEHIPIAVRSAGVPGEEEGGEEAAERARRRLRTHFAQVANADDGNRITTKTQDGYYLPPKSAAAAVRKRSASAASDSFLPSAAVADTDEDSDNDTPVYGLSPAVPERPMGRLAHRALGIERLLDEEKVRRSTEQQGSNDSTPTGQTVHISGGRGSESGTERGTPRKPWVEDEEDAREAFAAAWRTVAPTPSPTVASLKNVNSVTARKTATVTVSPASATHAERGVVGSSESEDRELLRKSRLSKRASMDSDVY